MKISLFLISYLIYRMNCTLSDDLKKYLDKHAEVVNETLRRYRREEKYLYDVKFNDISKTRLIGNYSAGEIFTIFNHSYALLDQNLYEISHANSTIIDHFLPTQKIHTLKATEYRDLGVVACVANSSIVHVFGYGRKSQQFFKIQNIFHFNVSDIMFFENHNALYMIVSNCNSDRLVSAVIYKFVDSHFDETEKILVVGAKQIHTFSNEGSEIIMILRDTELTTILYEFKKDQLKKIQKIDTGDPRQILSYFYKGKRYVLIFDKNSAIVLYIWTGSELVFRERFMLDIHLSKNHIFYKNNTPFLLSFKNEDPLVFSLVNNQLDLIYNSKFDEDVKIWDSEILPYENQSNKIILLETSTKKTAIIRVLSITIDIEISAQEIEEDKLPNCFTNLEKNIYKFRHHLDVIITKNNQNMFREADETSENNDTLTLNYQKLEEKYDDTKTVFENYINSKILVVNDTSTIKSSVSAKKAIVNDLFFEKLNNQTWRPEKWLSYSIPQNISGFINTKLAHITNLETNEPTFNDLLLASGQQTISGSVTVHNLTITDFKTNIINNVSMDNVYFSSEPVKIKGVKKFQHLNATHLEADMINKMEKANFVSLVTNSSSQKHDFNQNPVLIENLWVDFIDGVDFEKFKNSVFRLGLTETIEGNLIFNNLEAENMTFETLANRANFMTTCTDQKINSSIFISKIYARNVTANTINGIDFGNSVTTFGADLVQGPVIIKKVKVNHDLKMQDRIDKRYLRMKKDHVLGTNESDLLQKYDGNVRIKGNLFLKNVNLGKLTKIRILDREFNPDFDQYWRKTVQQVIPTRFEAVNGVSTPHIFTNIVNGVHVEDYMLNTTDQNKSTKFYFEDVTVQGNIVLKPNELHSPNLRQIDKQAVKVNGTFNIKGHKIYSNLLKVDHLKINQLNDIDMSELDDYGSYDDITEPQKFENLVIKGDFHFQKLSTDKINSIDLHQLLNNTLYIDQEENLENIQFKNISVKNLQVSELNGENMNKITSKMEKMKSLDNIENLHINGQVDIVNVHNLSTLNDLSVNHLLNEASKKFRNNTIFGKVKFLGHVKVKDFYVTIVNNVSLQKLSLRALYKDWDQNLTEHIKFKKLKTENLVTEKINDVYVDSLIDISSEEVQNLYLPKNLRLLEPVKMLNLNAKLECDLNEALKNLKNPLPQFWEHMSITGNVTFMDKECKISQIFDNVVSTNGNNDHVIRGKTTFSNHISANNMNTLKKINNVDIQEIIEDAFINDSEEEQIVTGKKTFIQIEAHDVISLQNTAVPEVNKIEISKIDSNIIDKNSVNNGPIKGKKVLFGGLQTKIFKTSEISGVKPENLVSFENNTKIPYAIFDSLKIRNNLNIQFVNKMPFDSFLNQRLLVTGPKQTITGNYFFQDLKINGNISTSQINDIKIENIVFDVNTQNIASVKRFTEDLEIVGNITVELLNGFKLSEAYERAVMKNEKAVFNGSLTILAPALINGNVKTAYINNFPMSLMLDTNSNQSLKLEAGQIHEITEKIAKFVDKYLNMTIRTPTEYLYLEKSTNLQISVANTLSAQIVETKDDVLIHIESEEDGHFCGLPKSCKCPSQQTMHISSEHSISSFINKAAQRIYSYYDDDIIVHLVTNSISTSTLCRANISNEISSLTWNTIPRGDKKGAFFMHQTFFNGYISGVKFFTAYGRTYVIIAFYYDATLDTHKMTCIVLQFNKDKSQLEEIQRIPTERTRSISLIHTAQGIILILGNEETVDVNTTTNIFRFNRYRGKFELLRQVPTFASLHAVGVVLEMDSLIILANKQSTLYILKYQEEFDNYYFYQSFQLDYPVSSVSVFYAGGFGISDAYLAVVTKNSKYYIYCFKYIEGWKLESVGEIEGIKGLIPFKLNKKSYLFAPSSKLSSLLTLVEHGSD